ncbi:MAG: hypothetical protein LBS86_06080, partial [Treponema sp.]|nr:hypothetical protein [Treponema sp.]
CRRDGLSSKFDGKVASTGSATALRHAVPELVEGQPPCFDRRLVSRHTTGAGSTTPALINSLYSFYHSWYDEGITRI